MIALERSGPRAWTFVRSRFCAYEIVQWRDGVGVVSAFFEGRRFATVWGAAAALRRWLS